MSNTRPQGCEECKEPATIHLTQLVNGDMLKVDYCAKCPHAKNIDDPAGFSLADQLLGLGASEDMHKNAEGLKCPSCGFTQPDFKKSGRLGCPTCYETFAEGLGSLLKNMHRDTKHKGKMPARFFRREELRQALDDLKDNLKKAVTDEDYERAAALRDQIREIEIKL